MSDINTKSDTLADAHRVFDRMWNLLAYIRHSQEIKHHMGMGLATEIDLVLDEAQRVHFPHIEATTLS